MTRKIKAPIVKNKQSSGQMPVSGIMCQGIHIRNFRNADGTYRRTVSLGNGGLSYDISAEAAQALIEVMAYKPDIKSLPVKELLPEDTNWIRKYETVTGRFRSGVSHCKPIPRLPWYRRALRAFKNWFAKAS